MAEFGYVDALAGSCSGACLSALPRGTDCRTNPAPIPEWHVDARGVRVRTKGRLLTLDPDAEDILSHHTPVIHLRVESVLGAVSVRVAEIAEEVVLISCDDGTSGCVQTAMTGRSEGAAWVVARLDPSQQLALAMTATGPLLDGDTSLPTPALPWAEAHEMRLLDLACRPPEVDVPVVTGVAMPASAAGTLQLRNSGVLALVERVHKERRDEWLTLVCRMLCPEGSPGRTTPSNPMSLTDSQARIALRLAADGWTGSLEDLNYVSIALA